MKKTIIILEAIGLAVALDIAFTGDGFALTNDMSGTMIAMENGITFFDAEPVVSATGYAVGEPAQAVDNGITIFARGPVSYDGGLAMPGEELVSTEGSAAGGLSASEGLHVENGITIFDTAPVDSN